MVNLNRTEWISLAYFSFFILLAWFRPLSGMQRTRITMMGGLGIILVVAAAFADEMARFAAAPTIRNLLPALLMVLAYWQSGCFYVTPNRRLQERLLEIDRRIAFPFGKLHRSGRIRRLIFGYLEIAYLFCYPMVPLGIGILYLLKMESYSQDFWLMVLPPSYFCYAVVAFVQTLPPRVLEKGMPAVFPDCGKIRAFNIGIIRHAGIQVNTFPSAHAAASMAVALALLPLAPIAGWILVWIAVSIALAAVAGRYHFSADVFLGTAIAVIWFLLLRLFT